MSLMQMKDYTYMVIDDKKYSISEFLNTLYLL